MAGCYPAAGQLAFGGAFLKVEFCLIFKHLHDYWEEDCRPYS